MHLMEDNMEYRIEDIHYTVNKVNCGHETILCCLDNQNYNKIDLCELYFIANPNTMKRISNTNNFGYNDLSDVISNINKNTNFNIKRIINENNSEKILEEIKKNSLVLLYVKASMLIYQKIRVVKYPFHMVIANGFDTSNNTIHIIDTFENDDLGISAKEHDLDMDFVLNHTVEYCVFERKREKTLQILNYRCIEENIKMASQNDELGLFYNINSYFKFLETINMEVRADNLAAFRWIVTGSFFYNLIRYVQYNKESKYDLIDLQELQKKWDIMLRKYIKDCLRKSNQCLYEKHEIAELIVETQNKISKI